MTTTTGSMERARGTDLTGMLPKSKWRSVVLSGLADMVLGSYLGFYDKDRKANPVCDSENEETAKCLIRARSETMTSQPYRGRPHIKPASRLIGIFITDSLPRQL